MIYLLDTNICIYLMKKQPPSVARRFEQLHFGDVAISTITLSELEHGVEADLELHRQRSKALNALLEFLPVLDFDRKAAIAYGKIRARGKHLARHRFDTLIAAHALSANAILVTNNTSDFSGVAGLTIENWIE